MTGNGKYAECIVEVQTSPTEVKLNYSSLILEKSAIASPTLNATILPESANVNTNITWSSSNTSVVAVDNGKLAIKGNGSTTITVKTDNGCRSQCTIVIRTSITSIEVSPTSKKMEVNQTAQLTATVNPADTTEKVQWTSSNTDVATVNDTGLVTAKATGTATITVKNSDGKKSATCVVEVTDGYLLGRGTLSGGTSNYGYITKIDSNGEKVWDKELKDLAHDWIQHDGYGPVYAITPTSDGGYLLGRGTLSEGTSNYGYITKIDSNGEKVWDKELKDLAHDWIQHDGYGPVYAICESK